jgi:hypothetical protein
MPTEREYVPCTSSYHDDGLSFDFVFVVAHRSRYKLLICATSDGLSSIATDLDI